jgi:MFS transporter, SP family, arabinose:H+ symporter
MGKSKLIFWSITSALAGFLFGFDTVVISGAEKNIQDVWQLSGAMHGWAISAALWGTVLGSFFGGFPTAKLGRKKTLISIGILYFISAVWSGMATDVYTFIFARVIGGIGVGISTVVAPLFISEIAPAEDRGKLAGMFQFNIVFGILVAFFSNYLINMNFEASVSWRWMLGVEAIPAVIYTLMCFKLPESPRWLITHAKKREEGAAIFREINPDMSVEEVEAMVVEVEDTVCGTEKTSSFWSSRLKTPILLAFIIAAFNQLSGINIILYFAPRLLGLAGIGDPILASVSLGIANLIFTFLGLYFIDKLGRRTLLYIGSYGYILSLGICALAFFSFAEFKVISSAIDVVGSVDKVLVVTADKGSLTDAELQAIKDGYAAAKVALADKTALADYKGDPVTLADDITPEETKNVALATKDKAADLLGPMSMVILICMIAFIAAHAIGQGAVIWVFIAEIFPNDHRAAGQSLGSFTHWIFAAGLSMLFPIVNAKFAPEFIFGFFTFMMILQLIWVKLMVPETKGISLEEIEKELGTN